jgi:hypothetical protein
MRKILTLVLFLIFTINLSFSQNSKDCPKTDLIPILVKNKYGYCDKQKNIIIEPTFDDAEPFLQNKLYGDYYNENQKYGDENYATVIIKGEYFRIDKSGKVICKYNPDAIDEAAEARDDEFNYFFKDNKVGVKIDSTIRIDCIYESINSFSSTKDTYFRVQKNNKYGVVDSHGNILIPIEYDDILYGFSDYLKVGLLKVKLENKVFFIDYCGNKYLK